MQNCKLELKEIIWEITGQCRNQCDYCGSKEVWKEAIQEDKILQIAEAIAQYPPREINISGGDPLLVSPATHHHVTERLKACGTTCKIIINPKSFPFCKDWIDIVRLYQWVGISVNNSAELKALKKAGFHKEAIPYTVISNFNLKNYFDYAEIEEFVDKEGVAWQVQYTMLRDPDASLAIYNNENATKDFFAKLQSSMDRGVRIVLADNLNSAECGAGISGLGILSNGDVIPCLSMRSWKEMQELSEGNLLNLPLERIWKEGFHQYRFADFRCCKDHCKNCRFVPQMKTLNLDYDKLIQDGKTKPPKKNPQVYLYGVPSYPDDGQTFVYGVKPNQVVMYGCFGSGTSGDFRSDTTTGNDTGEKKC